MKVLEGILEQLNQVIYGKPQQTRLALACLLAEGHLLIEDLPGVGKTTLAYALARLLGLDFSRVQFTSDMLPADIIGISIFERETSRFRFVPGAIFTQVLLADEVNRATPKTQSALLEAMEERQVSTEGETRTLPIPFFVIATQNPVNQVGTFPLPESQLDRFLMRLELGYPDRAAERTLLAQGGRKPVGHASPSSLEQQQPLLQPEELLKRQAAVQQIHVAEPIIEYVQNLLDATRRDSSFQHGLSPRAGLGLLSAARAWAYLENRDMVLPDDIQAVLPAVARHRLRAVQSGDCARLEDIQALVRATPIP